MSDFKRMIITGEWVIKVGATSKYLIHDCALGKHGSRAWSYCYINESNKWECSRCARVANEMVQDVADLAECWEFGARFKGTLSGKM